MSPTARPRNVAQSTAFRFCASVLLFILKDATGISDFKELTGDRVSKIAIGNPESVPAGHYGKEVLTSLNLDKAIAGKLVFAKDVRQVLAYVETGNVDVGFVL